MADGSLPLALDMSRQPPAIGDYVARGMDAVEGWGINPLLAGIFLVLDRHQKAEGVTGNVMEIGVHHGRSAILLALMAAPGERAAFIDLFDWQDQNIDFSGMGDRHTFERNLETWAPGCAADIIQGNSMALDFHAEPTLAAGLRFAHVDGGHYREAVLNDIAKTASVLKEGGVVVVDDFWHSGFPEVNEACHYYLMNRKDGDLVPVASGINKLVLTTPASHAGVLGHLRQSLLAPIGKPVRIHGWDAVCLDQH